MKRNGKKIKIFDTDFIYGHNDWFVMYVGAQYFARNC
jgi:hypothetical protein